MHTSLKYHNTVIECEKFGGGLRCDKCMSIYYANHNHVHCLKVQD